MNTKTIFLILCAIMMVFTMATFIAGLSISDLLLIFIGLLGMFTIVIIMGFFTAFDRALETEDC